MAKLLAPRTLEQVKEYLQDAKKRHTDVTLARMMLNHGNLTCEAKAYVASQYPQDFSDVLAVLAANNGACLYWQLPNQPLVAAAIAAGAIVFDVATDLAIHPDAVPDGEGAWRMQGVK